MDDMHVAAHFYVNNAEAMTQLDGLSLSMARDKGQQEQTPHLPCLMCWVMLMFS
jgi:hypothetical protein